MELENEGTALQVQGARIPRLGFGTWLLQGDEAYDGVRDALEIGYRHIDTARAYENEADVGRALADSGVDRGEFWLTTKLWTSEFAPDGCGARPRTRCGTSASITSTSCCCTGPNPEVELEDTLQALAELRDDGLIGHAGVSNFPAGAARARARDHAAPRGPGRVPPVPRPGRADRRLPRERPHADRLLAARPRRGPEGPGADRDRRGARQERRPGGAALAARPEVRHDRPEGLEPCPPAWRTSRSSTSR